MSEQTHDSGQTFVVSGADAQAMIQNAISAPNVAHFYANGVGFALSGGDVILTLFANGLPVGVLNLPFITARGLVEDLSRMLKGVEDAIGQPIPTPKILADGMARMAQATTAEASTSGPENNDRKAT